MTGLLKKAAFSLVAVVVVYGAVEGVLLLAGVTPINQRSDPYVGFAGYAPLFVETSTHGEPAVATAANKVSWFNMQQFPVEKAAGVQRIFCLGGSTTYGRPYDDSTSFCGWLREFLPAADPSRQWEVINAGGISYASYRIVRLMEELVRYEPDFFIVYTGHNEFLEQRTYDRLLRTPQLLRDVGSLATRLRLYSLLSDVIYPTTDILDTEIDAVLDRSIGPEDYHRDDAVRDAVLEHFRASLERMTRIGGAAGAKLVFVTPASNIRDFSPFKAETSAGLDAASLRQVERLKEAITEHLAGGEYERAAALADQGLSMDSRDADLLFLDGRARLALGDLDRARRAFVAARDEDVAPLRAPSAVTRSVAEVALESSSGLVDFASMIEQASPEGIPGDDHFLDHVHPSIEANRMLALALVDEMIEMGVVTFAPTWNEAVVASITARVEGGVDETANARALANVARVLSWAGKQEEADRLSSRATEMDGDLHVMHQRLTVLVRDGRYAEALPLAQEAARLMPDIADVRKMHGIALSENGRLVDALQELEIAARLDPSLPDVPYHLGLVLSGLGQSGRAEAAYRAAIELEPGSIHALNNLGILLAQRGDYVGAAELFERAVEVDPGFESAVQNLERARRRIGR